MTLAIVNPVKIMEITVPLFSEDTVSLATAMASAFKTPVTTAVITPETSSSAYDPDIAVNIFPQ